MKKKNQQKRKENYQKSLKEFFLDELMPVIQKKIDDFNFLKFIDNFISKNLSIKLLSLIFAIIFSFYVSLQDVDERRIVVPLSISVGNNTAIVNEVPKQIEIYIRGTRSALADLDVNYVKAVIDLRESDEGDYSYKPLIRGLGEQVRIIRLAPEKISVKISMLERKWVKVEPEFIHKVAKGYYLEDYQISPARILVSGPKEILTDLTSLKTEKISLKYLNVGKEIEVSLSATNHPSIRAEEEYRFKVRLFVDPETLEKLVEGSFSIMATFADESLYVSQKHFVNNIKLKVAHEYINQFNAEKDVLFFFDTTDISEPGSVKLKVRAQSQVEGKAKIVSFSPNVIVVDVLEKNTINTKNFSNEIIKENHRMDIKRAKFEVEQKHKVKKVNSEEELDRLDNERKLNDKKN